MANRLRYKNEYIGRRTQNASVDVGHPKLTTISKRKMRSIRVEIPLDMYNQIEELVVQNDGCRPQVIQELLRVGLSLSTIESDTRKANSND